MDKSRETSDGMPEPAVAEAWQQVGASFERFCLTAGVSALRRMMEQDAGGRAVRSALCPEDGKAAHRWGKTEGQDRLSRWQGVADAAAGASPRPGQEMVLPSWEAAQSEDLLGRWAMNLMLINVSTRRLRPYGAAAGGGHSGSGLCRRVEVGGVASVRGVVGGADEAVDGDRPVEAGPAGDPDRRHSYRKRSGVAGSRSGLTATA